MALLSGGAPHIILGSGRVQQGSGFYSGTLSGNIALDDTYPNLLKLDPGGSARDVTLPAEATSEGRWYRIVNAADAAENLVIKDDGGSTIGTANQNEEIEVVCSGAAWVLVCVRTIALS